MLDKDLVFVFSGSIQNDSALLQSPEKIYFSKNVQEHQIEWSKEPRCTTHLAILFHEIEDLNLLYAMSV